MIQESYFKAGTSYKIGEVLFLKMAAKKKTKKKKTKKKTKAAKGRKKHTPSKPSAKSGKNKPPVKALYVSVAVVAVISLLIFYLLQEKDAVPKTQLSKKSTEIKKGYLAEKKPNIILLTIDGLRHDKSELYFSSVNSRRNIAFQQAIASASLTPPSISSMLTGNYPYRTGVRNYGDVLPSDMPLFQEKLQQLGYTTIGIFGAGIVYYNKIDRGWDSWYIHRTGKCMKATQMTNMGLKTLNETLKKHPGKPFFLWMHYFDPHIPFQAPKKYENNSDGENSRYYNAEVRYANAEVERLLSHIWDENTILIVTADHGWGLWEHNFGGHAYKLYEEQLRIPLSIYLPGIEGDRDYKKQVRMVDFLPTILELLGSDMGDTDGVFLFDDQELPAYSETYYPMYDNLSRLVSIRQRGYKLIIALDNESETLLYNIDEDPLELKPLNISEHQAIDSMLRATYRAHIDIKNQKDVLRSLGYIA